MEVLYLVGLTVVVAIAAVVHQHPYHTVYLVEVASSSVALRHWYILLEQLLHACIQVQVSGTHLVVAEPEQPLAVDKHIERCDARRLSDHHGRLALVYAEDSTLGG